MTPPESAVVVPPAPKAEITAAAPIASAAGSVPVTAALIGAVTALLVTILKDFVFDRLKERRAKKQSEAEIYRRYLAPLTEAAEKIVWRADEIFVKRRHAFLKTATLPLDFNGYKRTSTLYRIATLLGWVRGIAIELRALPYARGARRVPIAREISAFQTALAEGIHVEQHRLATLAELWGFDLSGLADARRVDLGLRFEIEAHRLTGGRMKSRGDDLKGLSGAEKHRICDALIGFLRREVGSEPNPASLDDPVIDQAVRALSYREALLYRDWQDALGDAMIEDDPMSERRFRIIGYEVFTERLESETPWFEVFSHSIDDIDFDEADPLDSRGQQLRDVAAAVANILIAVSKTADRDLVGKDTLEAAKRLVSTLPLHAKAPSSPS